MTKEEKKKLKLKCPSDGRFESETVSCVINLYLQPVDFLRYARYLTFCTKTIAETQRTQSKLSETEWLRLNPRRRSHNLRVDIL